MTVSLLLNTDTWGLCLDVNGNLAIASAPYSLAQDAACAIKLFLGELWYDTTAGIPYFDTILGQFPSLPYLKAQMQNAALTVPGIVTATVYVTGFVNRQVTGQVLVTDTTGTRTTATF